MSIYREQIQTRIEKDREGFDESFFRLASVITGDTRDAAAFLSSREVAKNAIEDILKYFHIASAELPSEIETVDEQLEFLLRPSGITRRNVELTETWYKDGMGPLLGSLADGGVIALLPGKYSGYSYKNYATGETVKVSGKNAADIAVDAVCFYSPLPQRKMSVLDLYKYMASRLSLTDVVLIGAAALAATLLGLITPYVTRHLFGNVIFSGQTMQLAAFAILMFGAVISAALINITGQLLMERVCIKIDVAVQAAAMSRLMALPASFFKNYSAGELARRLQCLNMLCGNLAGFVIKVTLTTLFSLVFIGQIGMFAPSMAFPAFLVLFAGALFAAVASSAVAKASNKQITINAKLSGLVFSLFSGVQKIRLAGGEQRAFSKWARQYEQMAKAKFVPPLLVRVHPVITSAITSIGAVWLFFIAGQNDVSSADYMAFAAAFGMVSAAMASFTGIALSFAQAKPVFDLVKPILETEPETTVSKKMVTRLSGSIDINNVSFRYRDDMPPVLDDISLRIRSGQYVAIVGPSGCGKSTLLRILLGFEKADKGAVYYDGKDINAVDLKSLRKKIGCVLQNGKLMSGSVFSNITVSAPLLTLDEAWEAAELAGIANDIRDMPMGMHTIVAEGGGGISGGQKQRLMIARAVAPKPSILMLDEATSALDNITQKHVAESLNGLKCTRIVIAHRLSTIKQCGRIIYLEKGKIEEDGTYDELITRNGKFAELVKRQMLEQEG